MNNQAILTINAGSSSIKFAIFSLTHPLADTALVSGQIDGIGTAEARLVAKDHAQIKVADEQLPIANPSHQQAFDHLFKWFDEHGSGREIIAVGHRVVHGGQRYAKPIRLDGPTLEQLASLTPLAPLHQPHNLAGIHAIQALMPEVPQVACFDTAFHRHQPDVAQLFGLPRHITAEGVRRYGFHGLSYEYIARVLPQHSSRADGRVVICHLGNGSSMAAMVGRKGVASTMGFTAVDGLMMGTRTGNLDPGVILYLMENKGMGVKELTRLLYKESGLLGVSGISQDMRTLLASDKPEAAEAVELYCYRIVRELGSLAAAAGGLDALVFTGGIGENSNLIRSKVMGYLGFLGLKEDVKANEAARFGNAGIISAEGSPVCAVVIPTNEELMIAHDTARLSGL